MSRLFKIALSVTLCLSMLVSGVCVPVSAVETVNGTASSITHDHSHEHQVQTVAKTAPISTTAVAAAADNSRVILSKNGITVTAHVLSGNFTSNAYMCDAPELRISSTKGDISEVKVEQRSYDYDKHEYVSEAYNDGTSALEGANATYSFKEGARGSFNVTVTLEGGVSETVNIMIEHMLGGRDVIDYPATCTLPERHQQNYYCKTCGGLSHSVNSFSTDPAEQALGHTYSEEIITVSESENCEKKEVKYKICTVCGHVEYADGNVNTVDEENGDHDFTELVETKTSCTADGTTIYKCSKCGVYKLSSEAVTKATAHDMQTWAEAEAAGQRKPATCTENGSFVRNCKNCTYQSTLTYAATGHKWTLEEVIEEATCQKPGSRKVKCSVCGAEETQTVQITGHVYQITVEKAATCTEEGYYVNKCIYCGVTDGSTHIPIEATGKHTPQPDDGDCTTPVYCSVCGEIVVPGNSEHKFGSFYRSDGTQHWQECSNPNCIKTSEPQAHIPDTYTTDCTKNFTCKICRKYVSGTPHTFEYNYGKSNNLYHYLVCTRCGTEQALMHGYRNSDGYIDDGDCTTPIVCPDCGYVGVKGETEHSFTEWINVDENYHQSDCSNPRCTQLKNEPHDFGDSFVMENVVEATCTTPGSYLAVYTCADCGAHKSETVTVPVLDHKFGAPVVKESSCEGGEVIEETCELCGYTQTTSTPGAGHVPSAQHVIVDATCEKDGSDSIVCEKCGAVLSSEVIPQLEHVYGSVPSRVSEPTCTENGANIYQCENCGTEKVEIIEKKGHQWDNDEYVYNGDASCRKTGTMSRSCTVCAYKETVEDPAHGVQDHLFTNYVYQNNATIDKNGTEIAECEYGCGATDEREAEGTQLHEHTFLDYKITEEATCEKDAVAVAVCEICKEETDTKTLEGTALGHSEGTITVVTPADCTNNAIGMTVCVRCGKTMRTNIVMEDTALGHQWGEYVYNNDATTETDGTETASCNVCGETDTRVKEGTKLEGAHVFKNYVYNNDATCTNGTETAYCENGCGTTDTREAVGTALGHSYSDPVESKPATCTDDKEVTMECTRCKNVVTDTVPGTALGHDLELFTVAPATCTQNATGEFRCSRCDYVSETAEIEGSAAGHKFGEWIIETGSTCVADGVMYHECSVCLVREYRSDPADGHVWDTDYTVDVAATCDKDGSKSIHCLNCNITKEETVIPRREHDFKVTETVDATCVKDGVITKTCQYDDCNYQEHTYIPATGHNYGEPVIHDGATCNDNYYTVTTCSVCGDEIKAEVPDSAPGHQRDDGTVTKAPTLGEPGETVYKCKKCGEVIETVVMDPLGDTSVKAEEGMPKVEFEIEDMDGTIEVSEEEKGEKITVTLEISDASDDLDERDIALAEEAAEAKSATIAAYYEIDLYKQVGDNDPEQITSTNKEISITLEIPEEFRAYGRTFWLINVRPDDAFILDDEDSDPNTITVTTMHFSPFILAYKDAAPGAAMTHRHAFTYQHDENGHWMVCIGCGLKTSYGAHSYVNGKCVCGALEPVTGGESVDVNVPTEGKLNPED